MPVEILAATLIPATLTLAAAYPLRGQTGRHTPGLTIRVPHGWNPLTTHARAGIAWAATRTRQPGLAVNTVNSGGAR